MVGQIAQHAMEVHGEAWTVKELFVLPNEYIYWSIQIVMYPFMTGLVAGAFVLSSLYHVFGVEKLKEIARFSLVFLVCSAAGGHDAVDAASTATIPWNQRIDDAAFYFSYFGLWHRVSDLRLDCCDRDMAGVP